MIYMIKLLFGICSVLQQYYGRTTPLRQIQCCLEITGNKNNLRTTDLFHGLNILLSAFKFARPASYCVTYSFEVKACERGLTGKFEWRQRIIYTVKKVYLRLKQLKVKNTQPKPEVTGSYKKKNSICGGKYFGILACVSLVFNFIKNYLKCT